VKTAPAPWRSGWRPWSAPGQRPGEALAAGGLDQLGKHTWPDGRTASFRRILIDLIEEYARHVGQADLIREAIDGLTGEDPPVDFP
jgi:hypothetical protein